MPFSKYCLFKLHGRHARYFQLSDNMASQKHWQDEMTLSDSLELGSDTEEDLLTKEEAETIFRQECREWIKNNQADLLKSPFKTAYKRPWTKKNSSKDLLNSSKDLLSSQTITEKTGKVEKKEEDWTWSNGDPVPDYYKKIANMK